VIGAICFYPASISLQYGAFVGCLFVIALGLGTLENGMSSCINWELLQTDSNYVLFNKCPKLAAANPYITSLGSPQFASFRINAAQAFNGVGSFIAPLIASKAFFGGTDDSSASTADRLGTVKWAYVGIGCGMIVFFVAT
jgi:FHS family L-fucose permease-like MFS transporter